MDCVSVYASVGTSKILHAAVNPELFVMWDNKIRDGYSLQNSGYSYAYEFLPRMQKQAREAVEQVMNKKRLSRDDAIKYLTPCGRSLAKVIDEYNYVKFTLEDPSLLTN